MGAPKKDSAGLQLLKVIWGDIDRKPKNEINEILGGPPNAEETNSSHVPFIAAEMGNTKFVVELIRRYPDLMWKVNHNNHTIFHIAVKHRHEGIYSILNEIGLMKDSITSLEDKNDNNMLHLVGNTTKKNRTHNAAGVVFQMQSELLWFREVECVIPLSYREKKNTDGLKPYALFEKEHKDLLRQSEKWMKGMANQSMVVAALIATITFAAAITIPGGYNPNDGTPIFYRHAAYIGFIITDAISLLSSSASSVFFISFLTSRYAMADFVFTIHRKFLLMSCTLFISVISMMITFCLSFFVVYHKEMT